MTATIYATRTSDTEGAASIDNNTSSVGTAPAGYDYNAASGTLSWGDGDALDKSLTVKILGDTPVEGDETVNIALANPTGGAFLGTPNNAVLTISDISTPSPGGGGGGGGCFIATAAFGSYWEPNVMTLRQFRDEYLLTNWLGTRFIDAYYKYSPPMADYISAHDGLRFIIRIGFLPLIGFSWLATNYGMIAAMAAL